VLWVIGVREDGYREHLGVWLGDAESAQTWGAVFADLLERGLRGVRYVVSDEHRGLREALTRYLPGSAHQRCQVHYLRNVMAHAPSPERFHEAREGLKDAWDSANRAAADQRITQLISLLEQSSPRLARFIEESVEETLAFFELATPAERIRLRTTNAVEHDHAEMRRRTRVVRIFPNDASLLRLSTALAMDRNEQWATRRYLIISEEDRLNRAWTHFRHSA
jgi:putative transposase